MYHSVIFGEKNTWDDWHLVPSSRPVFNPPSVKTNTVDIPGGNGVIDLTEALTGYPLYNNRTGSLEFIVVNDCFEPVETHQEWYDIYSDIMDYLHGQKMKAVLEDDKDYYYEGRFAVNSWKSDQNYSIITIDYDIGPYKWSFHTSLDNDIFKNISVTNSYTVHTFDKSLFGRAPVCPSFVVSTSSGEGMSIRYYQTNSDGTTSQITATVKDGTRQIENIVFLGNEETIAFKCVSGTGTVSIDFRPGRF